MQSLSFDALRIVNGHAQHLHPAADADGESARRMVPNCLMETLRLKPAQIIDGLFASGKDHNVGMCYLVSGAAEAQRYARLGVQRIEISEIRE